MYFTLKNIVSKEFVYCILVCFICVIDVVLELCIIGDSFKDEMCIIDPRQSLRKESMRLYREKIEKRLLKKRKKLKRGKMLCRCANFYSS